MSIQNMNENMDIIQSLVIPGIDFDMDIIQKLDDEPNDVGGLTAAELKAEFDKAGNLIKSYINETLLPSISDTVAEEDKRSKAEETRIANENNRVSAENLRSQAENVRVENEQSRVQAEARRVAAELLRVQAENLRAAAEQSRNTAESEREAAEALRESTTAGIVVRATEQAEAAERSATRASNSEQQAAGYSRSAAESAKSASQSASNAAQSAQGAGTSAGNAQASANAAAEAVNHYPRINPSTRTWLVWDAAQGEFVDTGIIAEGRNGIEADGLWGVYVDEEGFLVVTYTGDDPPPLSISDDGYLVYTLNGQEIRVGKTVGPEGPAGPAGLGVPAPTPGSAHMIPAVNETEDGYKLVPQAAGGKGLKLVLDTTTEEDVMEIRADFSPSKKVYALINTPAASTDASYIAIKYRYKDDPYTFSQLTFASAPRKIATKVSTIISLDSGMLLFSTNNGGGSYDSPAINNGTGSVASLMSLSKARFYTSSREGLPESLIAFSFGAHSADNPFPAGTRCMVWVEEV